jgi:MoxR-like ATPase
MTQSRVAESALAERALFEMKRIIVGQDHMVERMLVAVLAGGHCLLEGVPGVAKTLAAETLATVAGGSFSRVQFTPDLVPSDIVGTRIYRPSAEAFDIELGPVMANVVLAAAPSGCPRRSWCWPPRTRSSPRASTSCPRRSATGS